MSRADARRNAARSTPQSNNSGCGIIIAIVLAIALVGAALGVGGVLGYQWYDKRNNAQSALGYPDDPEFRNKDNSVLLDAQEGAVPDDAQVDIKNDAQYAGSINNSKRLAFKTLTNPTDINFVQGGKNVNKQVKSDQVAVTLKYDPKQIPKGLTSRQVGMVVYDETLQSWVPILNAVADPTTNTVTARAPHFSWFSVVVLDPLQKTVEAAGKTIQSTINNTVTVADWMWQVVQQLGAELARDLTGTPPELKCDPASKRASVSTNSPFDKVKGCVQPSGDIDTVKLSNAFGFPMITDELPKGISLSEQDVWDNGASLPDMVRSLYWTNQNRAYISGAEISSVTATSDLQSSSVINMDLDSEALSFDIGIAVLSFLAPEAAPAKEAVKATLKSIVKSGTVPKGTIDSANSWVGQSYDFADCVAGTSHDLDEQPFSDDSTQTAANVAHDCLSSVFNGLNLQGALSELLGNLKVIPGVIQSALYATSAAVLDTLPEQFDSVKIKAPTATVTRTGSAPAGPKQEQPATKKPEASKPADNEAAWGNFKSLIGTWRAGGPTTVITIKPDGTGTYSMALTKCTDDYDAGTITNCSVKGNIAFGTGNPSQAGWGEPKALQYETKKPLALMPEIVDRWKGKSSLVTLTADGRSILFEGGPYDGLEFCTKEMYKLSYNADSPHWGRCDGTP